MYIVVLFFFCVLFFVQAEDGIRDLVRSRGLGDVYKRQVVSGYANLETKTPLKANDLLLSGSAPKMFYATLALLLICLLYTSDAADERSSVDLGGRRIIKKKTNMQDTSDFITFYKNKDVENRHHETVTITQSESRDYDINIDA